MSLLRKMQVAGNDGKVPGSHLNWFEKLKLRDPKTAKQVFEVIHEYLEKDRVGDFYNKYDIYEWLLKEGIDLQTSYASFSRVVRELKGSHGKKEKANTESKTRRRRKPRPNSRKSRNTKVKR